MTKAKSDPHISPAGRPIPPAPTSAETLDRVSASMKAATMNPTERAAIEAEVQKEKKRLEQAARRRAKAKAPPGKKPKAKAKASPKPSGTPRATVVKDKDGKVVMAPTAAQAATAVATTALAQGAMPPAGAVLAGASIRDARLNQGAQRDIEDADQAGVHQRQRERETQVGNIAVDRLRSGIERIERLMEEKKALSDDIVDIMAEMKSAGFDTKTIRNILRLRKMSPADREEQETLLDVYCRALGL